MSASSVTRVEPIRLAHLHSSNGVYGAERWTATQIKHLDRATVSPLVITLGNKDTSHLFRDFLVGLGYQAIHLPFGGKLSTRLVRGLRRMLIDNRIEILHTHGFKSDILGYFATLGLPVRLVATPHGWSADESLRIRVYEAVSRIFLRRFDRIYPLSKALLEDLKRRGFPDEKLRLVLNAVDTGAFDACYENRKSKERDTVVRLLFVGRLCQPKGVFDLLEAVAHRDFARPFLLRLVGDGPDRIALEQRAAALGIADRVEFIGAVPEVTEHLGWCDLLVLPSYSEGIPRVVMEAFAAGVPVVGTAIPGIRTLIEDGRTGWLTPLADAPALAATLRRAADDTDLAARIAIDAHSLIVDRFSAKRQALEFEAEYGALVDGGV